MSFLYSLFMSGEFQFILLFLFFFAVVDLSLKRTEIIKGPLRCAVISMIISYFISRGLLMYIGSSLTQYDIAKYLSLFAGIMGFIIILKISSALKLSEHIRISPLFIVIGYLVLMYVLRYTALFSAIIRWYDIPYDIRNILNIGTIISIIFMAYVLHKIVIKGQIGEDDSSWD